MPQLDFATYLPQLVWLLITFGLLYLVMSRVALPRIHEVLEERQSRLRHDLDEAERLRDEAASALREYDAKLAEARHQAHGVIQQARTAIAETIETRKQEIDSRIARQTAEAEARIAAAKAAAMAGVHDAAVATARAVVDRLAGMPAADDALQRAVDQALVAGSQEA